MNLSLTTPALLFPAISLLLLAYTNRFLTLAHLVRQLHDRYSKDKKSLIIPQIQNLKTRLNLIRLMQGLGVLSLLVCVICMFLLLENQQQEALWGFRLALILMIASLATSVIEIQISARALNVQISDLELNYPAK